MLRRSVPKLWKWTPPRMTVMDNGMKVVSFSEESPSSCVGVISKIGARYEAEEKHRGCSRLLEMLAYGDHAVAGIQAETKVTNNREWMVYNVACARWEVSQAMEMLSKIALPRDITNEKLQSFKDFAVADSDKLKIEPSKILFELLHQAAWNNETLSNPAVGFSDIDSYAYITPDILHEYIHTMVQPDRLTLVGKGVEHNDLLKMAEATFTPILNNWEKHPIPDECLAPPTFTGGVRTMENLTAPSSLSKFQEKNNTHIGVMMEGVPIGHPDHITMLVTQTLLGGGMSFSAGGPGKGILTKLYRCLCRHTWLDGIEAISAGYSDSGLLGIYGQAEHQHNQNLLNLLCQQLATITDGISEAMVNMAKNKFLFQSFTGIDERAHSIGEIGKHTAINNTVWSAEELHARTAKVTLDRIDAFIRPRLQGEFIKCTYGNLEGFQDLEVKSLVRSFIR
eukprot:TRINITY_DN7935_c0_g2_i1.p1 TRINITY_DN7935_c0_g2~~TRINITY_DN7935_c0_g2_i1.p1  ORF type:complete len:452 (+),score=116.08 TRINITY_DN7935_c0_g2_i1:56-1411(+)